MTEDANTLAEAPAEAPAPAAPAASKSTGGSSRKKTSSRSSGSKKTSSRSSAKKTSSRSSAKKTSTATKKESTPRSKFPTYKTEAAAEKVMKANLDSYKQYQVERDKNRNERGMEKHRVAYRTYKNAYTQLLALRKASGKGRRNATTS